MGIALALFGAGCAFMPSPGLQARRADPMNPTRNPSQSTGRAIGTDADDAEPGMFERLAHFSAVAALAAVLMVGSVPAPAEAARSGGRMGGMGSAARRAPPPPARSAQRASGGGSTNINIGVSPVISPFGYGGFGYGGFGFGPTILPVPFGGMGPSASDQMLQQQQRRDESTLDNQARQIDALQKEIAELKAKK